MKKLSIITSLFFLPALAVSLDHSLKMDDDEITLDKPILMAGVEIGNTPEQEYLKQSRRQIDNASSQSQINRVNVAPRRMIPATSGAGIIQGNQTYRSYSGPKPYDSSFYGNRPNPRSVKKKEKPRFVEGYKITDDGTGETEAEYVHGEVEKTRYGGLSGYLYNKKGKKTRVYGTPGNDSDAGIHARDNESSDYILDTR